MPPHLRKFTLTVHIMSSVGWLGAVAGFLALAIVGLTSQDSVTVRAAYIAMEPITRFVIVPLAFASLLTGLVQSLGTPWGLFRHYWVLIKLILTVVATVVLVKEIEPISYISGVAATNLTSTDLREARISLVVHPAGGLLVLVVTTVLSVYKPQGRTRYGQRKQHAQRSS